MDPKSHWERIYRTRQATEVSWYQPDARVSVQLIERIAPDRSSRIIDVGGGASTLIDGLLDSGYTDVTVLDLAGAALSEAKSRLGHRGSLARWIEADVLTAKLGAHQYDVWHDRAVFHFLTKDDERAAYLRNVMRSVKPGGHVIVSTFGPQGPTKCSGLEVARYDAESLHDQFGTRFRLVESSEELHATPSGATQQFLYCYCCLE